MAMQKILGLTMTFTGMFMLHGLLTKGLGILPEVMTMAFMLFAIFTLNPISLFVLLTRKAS